MRQFLIIPLIAVILSGCVHTAYAPPVHQVIMAPPELLVKSTPLSTIPLPQPK